MGEPRVSALNPLAFSAHNAFIDATLPLVSPVTLLPSFANAVDIDVFVTLNQVDALKMERERGQRNTFPTTNEAAVGAAPLFNSQDEAFLEQALGQDVKPALFPEVAHEGLDDLGSDSPMVDFSSVGPSASPAPSDVLSHTSWTTGFGGAGTHSEDGGGSGHDGRSEDDLERVINDARLVSDGRYTHRKKGASKLSGIDKSRRNAVTAKNNREKKKNELAMLTQGFRALDKKGKHKDEEIRRLEKLLQASDMENRRLNAKVDHLQAVQKQAPILSKLVQSVQASGIPIAEPGAGAGAGEQNHDGGICFHVAGDSASISLHSCPSCSSLSTKKS